MVATMIRQTEAMKRRLRVCRRWRDFNLAAANPTLVDLWSVLSSYEVEAEDRPGARAMVETLAGLPKIGLLRQACAGDPVMAAAVAVSLQDFANALRDGLDKIPLGLEPEKGQGKSEPSDDGEGEGQGDASDDEGDDESDSDDGGGNNNPVDAEVEAAVRRAAQRLDQNQAQERVQQTSRGYSLLGDGLTIEERIQMMQFDVARMTKILEMVGVMRQVTTETIRTIREEAPNATLPRRGYRGGSAALTMLQPTEMAHIAAGDAVETLFWKRWKDGRAKVTRTLAKIPAASGPVVVLGDESWSMRADVAFTGLPNSCSLDWLMSLVIAVADQCKVQRRPFIYRGWSTDCPLDRRFDDMTVANRLKLIQEPLSDGTNLILAMTAGMEELKGLARNRQRGDLLVITDGSWRIGASHSQQFKRDLQAANSQAHLLLVEQSSRKDLAPKPGGLWESVHFVEDIIQSSTVVAKSLV